MLIDYSLAGFVTAGLLIYLTYAQYLRVYIGQLRQKVEERPDDPRIILTEPGIGYRIAEG